MFRAVTGTAAKIKIAILKPWNKAKTAEEGKMMNKNVARKFWIVLFVLVAATMVSTQTIWAWEWVFAHGVNGAIERELSCTAVTEIGWGLTFGLKPFSGTWVHHHIPYKTLNSTASGTKQWKVRQVRLQFNTGDSINRVTNVHVYDGGLLLKKIDKTYATGWFGSWDLLLDLGAAYNVTRGLNVCFHVGRGDSTAANTVTVSGVGARFE
jgi:hypothetical protein